tara:strand:+ start:365 stop:1543 length:1179 start_codon:yes stop_codon:yes gene_type:complete
MEVTDNTSTTMITSLQNSISILGVSEKYVAGKVAWNDGKRSLYKGKVTSLSTCMTDTRVETQNGDFLPFLKPENMNETLGITDAKNIMFTKSDGTNVTAQDILNNIEDYIGYNGYTNINTKVKENEKLVVRVQTTFIPVRKGEKKKIVPSHYSYQTLDAEDPCNVIITGTPTGIYGHCDDVGANKLYGHTQENGKINNHYFEAETTNYGVGMNQKKEIEKESNLTAKPVSLGFEQMGVSCNTFLVMSFQREQAPKQYLALPKGFGNYECDEAFNYGTPVYRSCGTTAARMSLGNEIVGQKSKTEIGVERKDGTPIMLTIHKYYTTEYENDPKIETSDVAIAIADMDNIYRMCDQKGKLSNLTIMHEELTKEVIQEFKKKIKTDPIKDQYSFF